MPFMLLAFMLRQRLMPVNVSKWVLIRIRRYRFCLNCSQFAPLVILFVHLLEGLCLRLVISDMCYCFIA